MVVNTCFVLCFSLEMSALYTRGEEGEASRFEALPESSILLTPFYLMVCPVAPPRRPYATTVGTPGQGPSAAGTSPGISEKAVPPQMPPAPREPHPTRRCSPLGAFPNNPPPQRTAAASAAILGLRPHIEGRAENAGRRPQALPQPPATQRTQFT